MTSSTIPDQAIQAYVLADSDRRDLEQRRLINAWEAGWRACEAAMADAYEEGFADALMALKRAHHQASRLVIGEGERWGPGGREHFADPRPGDYMGLAVQPW